jgi:hypothetical protein
MRTASVVKVNIGEPEGNGKEGRRTILRTLVRHVSGDSIFRLE